MNILGMLFGAFKNVPKKDFYTDASESNRTSFLTSQMMLLKVFRGMQMLFTWINILNILDVFEYFESVSRNVDENTSTLH